MNKMTLQQLLESKNITIEEFAKLIFANLPSDVLNNLSDNNIQPIYLSLLTPFLECYIYQSFDNVLQHYANVFTNAIIENYNHFLMFILKSKQIQALINMLANQETNKQKYNETIGENESEDITRSYTYKENEQNNQQSQNQNLNSESFDVLDGVNTQYQINALNNGANGQIPTSSGKIQPNIANYNQSSDSTNTQNNKTLDYDKTENENKKLNKTTDKQYQNIEFSFQQINTLQQDLRNYLKPILLKIAKSFQYLYSTSSFDGVY